MQWFAEEQEESEGQKQEKQMLLTITKSETQRKENVHHYSEKICGVLNKKEMQLTVYQVNFEANRQGQKKKDICKELKKHKCQ